MRDPQHYLDWQRNNPVQANGLEVFELPTFDWLIRRLHKALQTQPAQSLMEYTGFRNTLNICAALLGVTDTYKCACGWTTPVLDGKLVGCGHHLYLINGTDRAAFKTFQEAWPQDYEFVFGLENPSPTPRHEEASSVMTELRAVLARF